MFSSWASRNKSHCLPGSCSSARGLGHPQCSQDLAWCWGQVKLQPLSDCQRGWSGVPWGSTICETEHLLAGRLRTHNPTQATAEGLPSPSLSGCNLPFMPMLLPLCTLNIFPSSLHHCCPLFSCSCPFACSYKHLLSNDTN